MSAVLKTRGSSQAEAWEWHLRSDMAAVFRVAARLGWNQQTGNRNCLMLPEDDARLYLDEWRWVLDREQADYPS